MTNKNSSREINKNLANFQCYFFHIIIIFLFILNFFVSRIGNYMIPSKHSSWWRRTEDVLKTSWRHNCKTSCKHVLKTSCKHVLKTSWRRFEDVLKDVLKTSCKTSWRRLRKTSSRRLGRQKVLRWRRLQDVLKTSWKTRNVCWVDSFEL